MGGGYAYGVAAFSGVGMFLYGYDAGVIATTFGQESFFAYFNPSATILGAIGSTFYAGVIIGLLIQALVANSIGRKRTIQLGGFITLIGAALQTGSVAISMFLVARIVTGVGCGVLIPIVPVYQAELAIAERRGRMVGIQLFMIEVGYFTSGWVGVGTGYATGTFQWRFPLGLQLIWASALVIGGFWLPFSPRWLAIKGRREEARAVLEKLHGADPELVEREYVQIIAQIHNDAELLASSGGKWQLFTKKSNRKRLYMGIWVQVVSQLSGALMINNYQTILYKALGYDVHQVLLFTAIFSTVAIPGYFLASMTVDIVGRKTLMLAGATGIVISLSIIMACESQFLATGSRTYGNLCIAFVMIYGFCYSVGFGPPPYIFTSEIFPAHLRAQGMAFSLFPQELQTIWSSQVTPIALANIGYKFFYFFLACTIIFIPVTYFWIVETKNLTLEDMNAIFGDTVAVKFENALDESVQRNVEEKVLHPHQESISHEEHQNL